MLIIESAVIQERISCNLFPCQTSFYIFLNSKDIKTQQYLTLFHIFHGILSFNPVITLQDQLFLKLFHSNSYQIIGKPILMGKCYGFCQIFDQ